VSGFKVLFQEYSKSLAVTGVPFDHTEFFLNLMYGTTRGGDYLRALAIPFLFYYIELPLAATMQAMDMSKQVMFDNILGISLKSILLYVLSLFGIGMYGFVIASSINIIVVSLSHYKHVKKSLRTS